MSELLTLHADDAQCLATAVAAGCEATPDKAVEAVVESLATSFGPVVQQIIELIKAGANNLPAILAALAAVGVKLPSWTTIVIQILLAIIPKPVATA